MDSRTFFFRLVPFQVPFFFFVFCIRTVGDKKEVLCENLVNGATLMINVLFPKQKAILVVKATKGGKNDTCTVNTSLQM